MRYARQLTVVFLPAVIVLLAVHVHAAGSDEAVAGVKRVVEQMNRAVTERDLPRLLATFAEGSVNVTLFPARKYGASSGKDGDAVKTADLRKQWRAIAPVLFAGTKSYQRTVRDVDIHVDGNLAVAWLEIETRTLSDGKDANARTGRFKEICVLRRYADGWKIVTITNNRHDIGTAQ